MVVMLHQQQIAPVKMWATQIQAINPATGQLCVFNGPLVPGATHSDAVKYCREHGYQYLEVLAIVVEREIVIEVGLN